MLASLVHILSFIKGVVGWSHSLVMKSKVVMKSNRPKCITRRSSVTDLVTNLNRPKIGTRIWALSHTNLQRTQNEILRASPYISGRDRSVGESLAWWKWWLQPELRESFLPPHTSNLISFLQKSIITRFVLAFLWQKWRRAFLKRSFVIYSSFVE